MRSERLLVIVAVMCMVALAVPFTADDSEASANITANGVVITVIDDSLQLSAGSSVSTTITFRNSNTNYVGVFISKSDNGGSAFSSSISSESFSIKGEDAAQLTLTVTTERLSKHGDYTIDVKASIINYNGNVTEDVTIPISIKVTSSYSSDSVYNKILGIFDPLAEPFDEPIYTALITFAIWVGIALGTFFLFRVAIFFILKRDRDVAKEIGNKTGITLVISIVFYGLSNAAMVYGSDEMLIATLQYIASFIYIPLVAYIVWNIYSNAIKIIFHRLEEQDKVAGADSSLIPLFNLLGEIVIIVAAASALLGTMGFDLVAIVTGAGIAGMAISLGAQTTLSEFFSGLNLLTTRPFKRGDMVKIGENGIYQVEKVGMLNSRFKNWISMEYIVIPNSKVVESNIVNITGKTMAYRMTLYYTVSYDSDVELVKKVLIDTAYNHPQVIVDGSYSKPNARLEDFEDSAIKFSLVVYITDFRDYITVQDELNEDVYRNLCKNNIEIPFNKLDVYIKPNEDDSQ